MQNENLFVVSLCLLMIIYSTSLSYALSYSNFPSVNSQSLQTTENTQLKINLTGNSGSATNPELNFLIMSQPEHGKLLLDQIKKLGPNISMVSYKPYTNYTGPDKFTFNGTNINKNASFPGIIDITINPPGTRLFFNAPAEVRSAWAFALSLLIVFLIFLLAFIIIRKIRQRAKLKPKFWDIVRDENWYPSLAIFQFLLWTGIVLFSYFGVYLTRLFSGSAIVFGIPPNLLTLMGISAAIPVVNGVVSQIKYGGTTPVNQPPTKQAPSDEGKRRALPGFKTMLMENDKITLPRFQMFAWTWIGIIAYLAILFSQLDRRLGDIQNFVIPDIDILFVSLMGLSQGAYIGTKISTSEVFSINEIRPNKLQIEQKDNFLTILGSNFGNENERGTVWIDYYTPLNTKETENLTREDIEESRYKPERMFSIAQPAIISWQDNRIMVRLDSILTKLDKRIKIKNLDDLQGMNSEELEQYSYIIRVEKNGLLTYPNNDARFIPYERT